MPPVVSDLMWYIVLGIPLLVVIGFLVVVVLVYFTPPPGR